MLAGVKEFSKNTGGASAPSWEVMDMSKKATEFQKKEMSRMYRGKEIFKPLNTGWIDENVACVRDGWQTSFSTGRAIPRS